MSLSPGVLTIDPRFMNVINWTGQTSTILAPFGTIPVLRDANAWRAWATYVIALPAVARLNPPRPESFDDWAAWARQFNEAARLLTV